jgi:hypothetical protein
MNVVLYSKSGRPPAETDIYYLLTEYAVIYILVIVALSGKNLAPSIYKSIPCPTGNGLF